MVGCVRWRPSVVGGMRTDDDGGSASRPAPAPPPLPTTEPTTKALCQPPPPPRGLLEGEGALGANSEQLAVGAHCKIGWGGSHWRLEKRGGVLGLWTCLWVEL